MFKATCCSLSWPQSRLVNTCLEEKVEISVSFLSPMFLLSFPLLALEWFFLAEIVNCKPNSLSYHQTVALEQHVSSEGAVLLC